jgi:integrase/recombinase XerD
MSDLHHSLDDYLALRREFGYQLENTGELLVKFVDFCERADAHVVTIELALTWATLPKDCSRVWSACRLRAVRGFARYLHAIDPRTEVPPTRLLPDGPHRVAPYLYSLDQVRALMEAARALAAPLRAANSEAIIGLLATSGLRVGEALRLDRGDVDLREGALTVRLTKFNKTRRLPLHPTSVGALSEYAQRRDQLIPRPSSPAFFVSASGTRVTYGSFRATFSDLVHRVRLEMRPSCRPCIHGLRHTFAMNVLTKWYEQGADVPALLPSLSTYLGHTDPASTYWYLSGSRELLEQAAMRLEALDEVAL